MFNELSIMFCMYILIGCVLTIIHLRSVEADDILRTDNTPVIVLYVVLIIIAPASFIMYYLKKLWK